MLAYQPHHTPFVRDGGNAETALCRETPSRRLRFDRVCITSIFGDPSDPSVWSAAPASLGRALGALGIAVEHFNAGHTTLAKTLHGLRYMASGLGRPQCGEDILRAASARRAAATRIDRMASTRRIRHVLHTGTLDLPSVPQHGVAHYLYCDHNWALALRHRPALSYLPPKALRLFELLERQAMAGLSHVFTFGDYVRRHMIEHYGLAPSRVTAVGCGMGRIAPYYGPKPYDQARLLFVAKHLFLAKGGALLDQAFRIAHRTRPDLRLTVVGDRRSGDLVPPHPAIEFRDRVSWEELQRLFRQAALLVQPMLNDPWGQVYTEALISRTPVIGLDRNGLPEIVQRGRHGFLVGQARAETLARTILEAVSDPVRLERMGHSGQRHVMRSYAWDLVAQRMAWLPETPSSPDTPLAERTIDE